MVWADINDDLRDGDALKKKFWQDCKKAGIERDEFDKVVFVFAKDRLENWIELLNTGETDEGRKGPQVKLKEVVDAARRLASICSR